MFLSLVVVPLVRLQGRFFVAGGRHRVTRSRITELFWTAGGLGKNTCKKKLFIIAFASKKTKKPATCISTEPCKAP